MLSRSWFDPSDQASEINIDRAVEYILFNKFSFSDSEDESSYGMNVIRDEFLFDDCDEPYFEDGNMGLHDVVIPDDYT